MDSATENEELEQDPYENDPFDFTEFPEKPRLRENIDWAHAGDWAPALKHFKKAIFHMSSTSIVYAASKRRVQAKLEGQIGL